MRLVSELPDPLPIGEVSENVVLFAQKENLLVLDDQTVLFQAFCKVQCTFNHYNCVFNLVCQRVVNHYLKNSFCFVSGI